MGTSGSFCMPTLYARHVAELCPAAVGVEDVEAAHLDDGLADEAADILAAAEVGADGQIGVAVLVLDLVDRQAGQLLQLAHHLARPFRVAAEVDDYSVPPPSQQPRRGRAHPGTARCDEGHGAVAATRYCCCCCFILYL